MKQEYKEYINFVLVTPQHNILWVILPDKDSHVPKMTKSNRNRSPQWDYNALKALMQNRGNTSCSTHNIGTATSLSTLTYILQNTTWPVVSIKRVHSPQSFQLWSISESYRCRSPLRILTTDQTGIQSYWSRPSWVNKERQSLKYVLYINHM